jgi:hypothetical protein
MADTKRTSHRIYLSDENVELMCRGAEATELSKSEFLSKLAVAALKAVAENNFKIGLPLRFRVLDDLHRMNEPKKTTYRKNL